MEPRLSPSEYAKQKLILAAIDLFAEQGVDSVSLRMINRNAGHKNNSALHYHFGSKNGLVEAVDAFIQRHFDAVREPYLSALEERAKREEVPLRDAVAVFVNPYAEIIENFEWGYQGVRTIARMEFDSNDEVHQILHGSAGEAVKRLAKVTRPLLPSLSPREFKLRYNFAVNATIRGFADHRNLQHSYLGNLAPRSLRELADFYITMGTAVLTAPA